MSYLKRRCWVAGNPLYDSLYKTKSELDDLRADVLGEILDSMPESVWKLFIDELLTAELYGDQLPFLVNNLVDGVVSKIVRRVLNQSCTVHLANGEEVSVIPFSKATKFLP